MERKIEIRTRKRSEMWNKNWISDRIPLKSQKSSQKSHFKFSCPKNSFKKENFVEAYWETAHFTTIQRKKRHSTYISNTEKNSSKQKAFKKHFHWISHTKIYVKMPKIISLFVVLITFERLFNQTNFSVQWKRRKLNLLNIQNLFSHTSH